MSSQPPPRNPLLRHTVIGLVLLLGVYWSLASAISGASPRPYPETDFLVTGTWLKEHLRDQGVVVVDVRTDEHFDDRLIPGAVRLPWSVFRYTDTARGIGGRFVGIERAQELLGRTGLARSDTLILYDSVARDGGATASYVFWVLDLLGHPDKRILARGIDGWTAAGGETVATARQPEAMHYQALADEIRPERRAEGEFIRSRLGDRYYQLVDVRSRDEYLGETPNVGIDGRVLKLGHIPTAVNVDYRLNWRDADSKAFKSYDDLLRLYRGLDPARAVVTYCHSARRGSFGYFTLRLMGFNDVRLYDGSWYEWGHPMHYFPVETRENQPAAAALPEQTGDSGGAGGSASTGSSQTERQPSEPPEGGYVSCGG